MAKHSNGNYRSNTPKTTRVSIARHSPMAKSTWIEPKGGSKPPANEKAKSDLMNKTSQRDYGMFQNKNENG